MCPKYLVTGKFGDRSEVFAFGVTMLEVLTGKCNEDVDGGLYDFYIEEASEPIVADPRAGDWCVVQLHRDPSRCTRTRTNQPFMH